MPTIKERDSAVTWHPYTPMKTWPESIAIVKGEGVYLIDEDGNRYIDAIASWWVNLHGHSNTHIAKRISEQLTTLEHCIFANFTHEPAVELAEKLLKILPGDMARIFYSDNGSTAVEVALKMAWQYWINKGQPRKKIIALENAYHGDTFGAMAVSGRSVFTEAFTELLFDVTFIPFPSKRNEAASMAALEEALKTNDAAAFIVEPLVQGSAGMCMYTPEVLQQYFTLCKQYNTLVIADEVMTGFGRTGPLFACDHITAKPDMVCLSKGLTGGFLPMGVTSCTKEIFDAFYDDDKKKMLYHGHSYTANAAICAAALASMELTLHPDCEANRARIAASHSSFAETLKGNPLIADVRQTGTIIAIEIAAGGTSYHNTLRDKMFRYFLEKKIIMRPLGNIIYILPPYCITNEELGYVYGCIRELLAKVKNGELG